MSETQQGSALEAARKAYAAAKAMPPETRLTRSIRYEAAVDAVIRLLEARNAELTAALAVAEAQRGAG